MNQTDDFSFLKGSTGYSGFMATYQRLLIKVLKDIQEFTRSFKGSADDKILLEHNLNLVHDEWIHISDVLADIIAEDPYGKIVDDYNYEVGLSFIEDVCDRMDALITFNRGIKIDERLNTPYKIAAETWREVVQVIRQKPYLLTQSCESSG